MVQAQCQSKRPENNNTTRDDLNDEIEGAEKILARQHRNLEADEYRWDDERSQKRKNHGVTLLTRHRGKAPQRLLQSRDGQVKANIQNKDTGDR